MLAVILAGGLGTRLRPLTFSIPKPLLPVGERPILEVIITRLKEFGFDKFVLSVGYRAELIETYFGDGTKLGVGIQYLHEEQPLGTAGPLANLRDLFIVGDDDSFLVMNGDLLTDLDFAPFVDHHQHGDFDLTVAVKEIERKLPYGVVETDTYGRVQRIVEKPASRYPVSGGIYLLRGRALSKIPADTHFTIPDLVDALVADDRKVGSYPLNEYWQPVEQQEDMENARAHLEGEQ
jgi:NDP-sugar pyrophosphorylase family protein